MSLHVQITQEAQAALAAQKRNSTVSSLIIAVLTLFLIGLLMFIIALTVEVKTPPEIISYAAGVEDAEVIEKQQTSTQVERKPSAPSSSMSKVIASSMPSANSVPVPDIDMAEPSVSFGNGDDFGEGWGDDQGWGSGGSSGGASFFKQKVNAQRICFVIDYSKSMSGKRIKLLKKELVRSVAALPSGIEYQMIFFAGPAWTAGSTVVLAADNKSGVVSHEGVDYKWTSKNASSWKPTGRRLQPPAWLKGSKENIDQSLSTISNTPLVYGTAWEAPLKTALDMNPKPDVIFFMTDGLSGKDSESIAKSVGMKAKRLDIKINAIAMMDPSAKEAMGALAERSGGQFSLVKEDGSTEVLIKAKSE